MLRSYEILLAGERVADCEAETAQMALLDHLRLAGCRDEDIVRLGSHSVAWRGAVYRARLSRVGSSQPASGAEGGGRDQEPGAAPSTDEGSARER